MFFSPVGPPGEQRGQSGSGAQSRCFHPNLPSRLARLEPCPWPQALSNTAAEGTVYSASFLRRGRKGRAPPRTSSPTTEG